MQATLTWLDLTASDRDKMRRVLDLFKEQGTLDEMGLGSPRDVLSDALFPGTSSTQTRLRYVLFIPWLYRRLEDRKVRAAEVARAARTKLNDGPARPRAHKRLDQVWQRIGRLKAKHSRGRLALPDQRHRQRGRQPGRCRHLDPPPPGRLDGYPSGRLLPAQQRDRLGRRRLVAHLHHAHRRLGRLPSELGLRPIYHRKPARADGHLFITVIAYQLVQVIRTRLRAHGEHARWTTLRRVVEGQQRITATFRRPDGRTLQMCARPPQPNPISGPSTTRSASTHIPAASARRSSDRAISRFVRVCSATRAFLSV